MYSLIALSLKSAMYRLSLLSSARPRGAFSPEETSVVTVWDEGIHSLTALSPVSAMYTLPLPSTATP